MALDTHDVQGRPRRVHVETLVPASLRPVVECAVALLGERRSVRSLTANSASKVRAPIRLRHKSQLELILADFAYASHCVLIAHVELAMSQRMGVSPDVVLRDLLSPWDATLPSLRRCCKRTSPRRAERHESRAESGVRSRAWIRTQCSNTLVFATRPTHFEHDRASASTAGAHSDTRVGATAGTAVCVAARGAPGAGEPG